VDIILHEEALADGFLCTTQRHREEGGKLIAIGAPAISWRAATQRERLGEGYVVDSDSATTSDPPCYEQ
jgi:hypothetical protein